MPKLITIPFSHFCEKARWSLDHARVSFKEEGHAPLWHISVVKRAGGRRSVPTLVLDDGGVLDDSPLIVRWADARATTDRKLLPPDGPERDEALALERHLDVDFAPHVRRVAYHHLLLRRQRALAVMGIETPRLEHAVLRMGFPIVERILRRAMRIDAAGAQRSLERARQVFAEIGKRLSDGRSFLMGERFGAADIAFAAFAAPLVTPEEHPLRRMAKGAPPVFLVEEARDLRESRAGVFALQMYREHRAASS